MSFLDDILGGLKQSFNIGQQYQQNILTPKAQSIQKDPNLIQNGRMVGTYNRGNVTPIQQYQQPPTQQPTQQYQQIPQAPQDQYQGQSTQSPTQQYQAPQQNQTQQNQKTQKQFDTTPYMGHSTEKIPQPPKQIADLISKYFKGDEARALATSYFENRGFNPGLTNKNKNGSTDYGLFQINDATFNELKSKNPSFFQSRGINTVNDLFNPEKNVATAYALYNFQKNFGDSNPWSQWRGWQDNGYDLNQQEGNIASIGGGN